METDETLVNVLRVEAEREIQDLVRLVCESPTDNLKGLEQRVLQAMWRLGRALLAAILAWRTHRQPAAAHREGNCGHQQHLVGWRPKKLLTVLGEVAWSRPYYQCQPEEGEQESGSPEGAEQAGANCTHGEAPADALWGVQGRQTSAGVQEAVSYLAAHVTLEEAAAMFSRLLPLGMSARQVLALLRPVGEALRTQEDAQVQALWEPAAEDGPVPELPYIERLYIELDGITARLRRGSVPMKPEEHARPGDVYREVKVGAVFTATRGPERVFPGSRRLGRYPLRGLHPLRGPTHHQWDLWGVALRLGATAGTLTCPTGSGVRGWGTLDLATRPPHIMLYVDPTRCATSC